MSTPAPAPAAPPPYNRIGANYRDVPARKIPTPIYDAHTHVHNVALSKTFIDVANAYNVEKIWTMSPLEDVDPLRAAFPGRFEFIAIPRWQQEVTSLDDFMAEWQKRLDAFREKGSRIFKFHMAPGSKKRWNISLDHPAVLKLADHAYHLGYKFMTHVGDPKAWFNPGNKYESRAEYGTFAEQFESLERFLARYPDRIHMGAHMGGCLEDLDSLQARLDKFPNYVIDSSATKWIVRAVAEQSTERVRQFVIKNQDRILFGSDLVVGDKFNWDHYASRWWTHQKLWETEYQGESPIDDPDAKDNRPMLTGLNLPAEVLQKMYRTNAERYLLS